VRTDLLAEIRINVNEIEISTFTTTAGGWVRVCD